MREAFDQSESDWVELESVLDVVETIIQKIGGGKRSGKEWEGMAKALKYIFHWVKIQKNNLNTDQTENQYSEHQWPISENSRDDLVSKCLEIIQNELSSPLSGLIEEHKDLNYLRELPKTGANILLICPPGFIPFSGLQAYCQSKDFDLSYKLSQKKNKKTIIRLISPSVFEVK